MVPPVSYYTPSTITWPLAWHSWVLLLVTCVSGSRQCYGTGLGWPWVTTFSDLFLIWCLSVAGWLGLGELVSDCPVPRLLHQQTVIIPAVTVQQWSESGKCADRRLMELCPRPHAALPPPNIWPDEKLLIWFCWNSDCPRPGPSTQHIFSTKLTELQPAMSYSSLWWLCTLWPHINIKCPVSGRCMEAAGTSPLLPPPLPAHYRSLSEMCLQLKSCILQRCSQRPAWFSIAVTFQWTAAVGISLVNNSALSRGYLDSALELGIISSCKYPVQNQPSVLLSHYSFWNMFLSGHFYSTKYLGPAVS